MTIHSPGGPGGHNPISALLRDIAQTGRDATPQEIELIRAHVAGVGYEPGRMRKAGGRLSGVVWQGKVLEGRTELGNDIAHYLIHVQVGREWPDGTTFDEYIASLRGTIRDPAGGVLLDQVEGIWRLTFVARSGRWRGPNGAEWIAVGYGVDYGYWVTGFQLRQGPTQLTRDPRPVNQRWLKEPG